MTDKEKRYEEYCSKYPDQVRLKGYIRALEADNENIRDAVTDATPGRGKRRAKKLIKINDKDIRKYNRMLSTLPEAPEFK